MTVLRAGLAFLLVAITAGAVSAAQPDTLAVPVPPAGDFLDHPVFYERFPEPADSVGAAELRRGFVRIPPYDPVDVSGFDWSRDARVEYTWWMQMQEMRFVLPLIDSPEPADRALAKDWLTRWFAVHMIPEPAFPTWGEPMAVAYRAMVFVYYLKKESLREDRDADTIGLLQAAILDHRAYLAQASHFDATSNHGFIDALGLFETTRVFADGAASALALERLRGLMEFAVSPPGIEMEHSVGYHFVVLRWVEQAAEYLSSLPRVPVEAAERLGACAKRMRVAAYFMQDHAGVIPPIGDTDSVRADAYAPAYRLEAAPDGAVALYDAAAGYAIYKGNAEAGDCRYLIFRIPNGRVAMQYHLHDDALSVFFSHAGETILGDGGRYSYASGPQRSYFVGPLAHSTVVLAGPSAGGEGRARRLARQVADRSSADENVWFASTVSGNSWCRRVVSVPPRARSVTVVDSLVPIHAGGAADDLWVLWNLGVDVAGIKETGNRAPNKRAWMLKTRGGQRARLAVSVDGSGGTALADVRLIRGATEPMMGWYSPRHGVMRPTTSIVLTLHRDAEVVLRTEVEIVDGECRRAGARAGKRR